MKHVIPLILCLAIALSISGCSRSSDISPTDPPTGQTLSTADETTTSGENSEDSTEPESDTCPHILETIARKESTCSEQGYVEELCRLCGYNASVDLPLADHILLDATCTAPKICRVCAVTQGTALGHKYVNGQCVRCGHTQVASTPECSHDFEIQSQTYPSCTQNGSVVYTCRHCGYSYSQSTNAVGHSFSDASCLTAQKCRVCGISSGSPLGHAYGTDHLCIRCGIQDPNAPADTPKPPVQDTGSFTLTVRAKNTPVANITATLYVDGLSTPAGSGRTDAKGKVVISMTPGSTYKIILSDVPSGYAYNDSYSFNGTIANINLTLLPVLDPKDHSNGRYQVGSTMADFTLTDTDGNTYTLSQLLKTKKSVILNFWYVNCIPCKQEFPHFEELYKLYSKNIQLLALSHMDSESDIKQLKHDMGLTFPMIRENIGMKKGFNLELYPTTVVIGQGMEILEIHEGSYTYDEALALFETYS